MFSETCNGAGGRSGQCAKQAGQPGIYACSDGDGENDCAEREAAVGG